MKNELKNRREFFKEAAKKSLPILGMAVLATIAPTALQSCKKVNSCNGCTGSCSNSCAGSCENNCARVCSGSCTGQCISCKGTCSGLCTRTGKY
jgi:hypothetical protein